MAVSPDVPRHVLGHPAHGISGFLENLDQRKLDQAAQDLRGSTILVDLQVIVFIQILERKLQVLPLAATIDLSLSHPSFRVHPQNPAFRDLSPFSAGLIGIGHELSCPPWHNQVLTLLADLHAE